MSEAFNRRNFLKLVGSTGLAGAVGCEKQPGRILMPLLVPSEEVIPGVATWYATTCGECPAACGVTVRTREGRATKVEGNPDHPINQGGLCIRGQASLQGLYNPDRFREPLRREANGTARPISWEEGERLVAERVRTLMDSGHGNRIVFLSGQNGDSLERLIRRWMRALGSEQYLAYEAFSYAPIQKANQITFGKKEIPYYDIERADYLLGFGADFLETWLSPVGFARAFAQMRAPRDGRMGKFVQAEPRLSLTGANADEWIAIKPGTEMFLALGMARYILSSGLGISFSEAETRRLLKLLHPYSSDFTASQTGVSRETIERAAKEFASAQAGLALGGGVAVRGENATGALVALNLLNYVSGRFGQTIHFDQGFNAAELAGSSTISNLTDSMFRDEVELLFIHHTNPVFTLPPELRFSEAMRQVPLVVSFSSFPDETSDLAHIILPDHTPLEQWGDFRPAAGVHGLMQPAMNPVFNTRASEDVLLGLAKILGGPVAEGIPWQNFHEYLKQTWKDTYSEFAGTDFDDFWRDSVQRGGVWSSFSSGSAESKAAKAERLRLSEEVFEFEFRPPRFEGQGGLFLHLYPSPHHYDGRGANRPWLQEIPDPVTNIVWDSWIEIHPDTAGRLGVTEGDVLCVESPAGHLDAPAYIYAGIRPDTVAIPIGLGHQSYGRYAKDRGVNPIVLLPSVSDPLSDSQAWSCAKVHISKTGLKSVLVRTDGSAQQLDRGISQIIPLSALTAGVAPAGGKPNSESPEGHGHPSMYPPHAHKQYRWGMAIDLSACIGCGACVAACYAENNIPVVGKEQVAKGRHMAWIRIERYWENISASPDVRFSPMLCQQCDNAPCEPVCPVFATMHNSEGLNVQVYNRCVGTRYCSNNCPYKVRAFNWFTYEFPEPLNLQLNPDVSVRSKGVMEKCTFCTQRIREAKDRAKDAGRFVRDREAVPACAQSCPAQAIVFGNLLDSDSAVSKLSRARYGYQVFEELNTRPAITYLPKVKQI